MMHIDTFIRSAVGASAKRSGARINTSRTSPIIGFQKLIPIMKPAGTLLWLLL